MEIAFLVLIVLIPFNIWGKERSVRVLLTVPPLAVPPTAGSSISSTDRNILKFENNRGIELVSGDKQQTKKSYAIYIRQTADKFETLLIRPLDTATPTTVNDRKVYRGSFIIKKTKDHLLVINLVHLEEYVAGVVGGEMPANWPLESLKAQAVVARTYAAQKMNERETKEFDLVDTVMDQVYDGVSAEHPVILKAVTSTKGEILKNGSEVITAYYHADCGGRTEEGSNVFPGDLPYLTSVTCTFHKDSPYQNWSKTITTDELKQILELAGYTVSGDIDEVRFVPFSKNGRIDKVIVRHEGGVVEIQGKAFRKLIGPREMRSTNARIEVTQQAAVTINVPVAAAKAPLLTDTVRLEHVENGFAFSNEPPVTKSEEKSFSQKVIMAFVSQRTPLTLISQFGDLTVKTGEERPFLVMGSGEKWIRRRDFQITWMQPEQIMKKTKAAHLIPETIIVEQKPAESTINNVQNPNSNARQKDFFPKTAQHENNAIQQFSTVTKKVPVVFKIYGQGWGHGVGLCQWGARGMAGLGYDYKQILHFYYKDVILK